MYTILDELYFFLPALIALGIITSYEDLKYGKIRNKYIIAALVYSFAVNIGLILFFRLKYDSINYLYITELIISLLLSLGLGFILWYNRFWTSGDAKLYFAYSALIPLSAYGFGYIKYMPNLTILINTFIPLAVFYFFKILLGTSWNEKKQVFKKIFEIKPLATYVLLIFAILWMPVLLVSTGLKLSFVEMIIITMIASTFLSKFSKKNMLAIFIIIGIMRLILDKSVYSILFLKQFGLFLFIFVILQTFFGELGKSVFSENKRVKELKKGMILADKIYKKCGKYEKEEESNPIEKKISNQIKKITYFFKQTGNGLTSGDITKLKRLDAEKKINFSKIRINKITPFAHYMFMGVLITLIFKGNFIAAFSNFDYILTEIVPKLPILLGSMIISALITSFSYYYIKQNNKHYK